jgi:hypothetical protein
LKRPDELVVGINERDKAYHDPYLLNARTGALKKLFDNTEKYATFLVDDDLNIRFVARPTPDGGTQIFSYDNGKTTLFETIGFEDAQTTGRRRLHQGRQDPLLERKPWPEHGVRCSPSTWRAARKSSSPRIREPTSTEVSGTPKPA